MLIQFHQIFVFSLKLESSFSDMSTVIPHWEWVFFFHLFINKVVNFVSVKMSKNRVKSLKKKETSCAFLVIFNMFHLKARGKGILRIFFSKLLPHLAFPFSNELSIYDEVNWYLGVGVARLLPGQGVVAGFFFFSVCFCVYSISLRGNINPPTD